eukprot:1591745-Amphidinium_carterae.1
MTKLQNVEADNGVETWRQLILEFDPRTAGRKKLHLTNQTLYVQRRPTTWRSETLRSRNDCKSGGVFGPDPKEDTEVTYLNRMIRYVRGSNPRVEIEHGMRHIDNLMRDLGKGVP